MYANETITITIERYNQLIESERVLQVLESAGVDNWEGYDDAMLNLFARTNSYLNSQHTNTQGQDNDFSVR